jgi:hypothetical protein
MFWPFSAIFRVVKTYIPENHLRFQGYIPLSPVVVYVTTDKGALLKHGHHQAHQENK